MINILENENKLLVRKRNKKQNQQRIKLNRILSTQKEFMGDTRHYLANLSTCTFFQPSYRLSKRIRLEDSSNSINFTPIVNVMEGHNKSCSGNEDNGDAYDEDDDENIDEDDDEENGEDSGNDLDSDQEIPEEDQLTSTFTALFPEDNFFNHLQPEFNPVVDQLALLVDDDSTDEDYDDIESDSEDNISESELVIGDAWEDLVVPIPGNPISNSFEAISTQYEITALDKDLNNSNELVDCVNQQVSEVLNRGNSNINESQKVDEISSGKLEADRRAAIEYIESLESGIVTDNIQYNEGNQVSNNVEAQSTYIPSMTDFSDVSSSIFFSATSILNSLISPIRSKSPKKSVVTEATDLVQDKNALGAYQFFCPANLDIDKEVEELLNMSFSDCEHLNNIGITNSNNGSSNSTILESDQIQA